MLASRAQHTTRHSHAHTHDRAIDRSIRSINTSISTTACKQTAHAHRSAASRHRLPPKTIASCSRKPQHNADVARDRQGKGDGPAAAAARAAVAAANAAAQSRGGEHAQLAHARDRLLRLHRPRLAARVPGEFWWVSGAWALACARRRARGRVPPSAPRLPRERQRRTPKRAAALCTL